MRPSVDQPSRGSGSGRQLRRWAPIVAIVVVVAVVAVVLVVSSGDDKETKTSESKATGAAPAGAISFDEAKAKGLDATFAKTCDQQTGRVAIPFYFAPDCFANVKNNGGATSKGVTADTIKVVVYSAPENDPIINFVTAAIKNSDTRAQSKQDTQAYIDLFSRYYQTYGRKVQIQFLDGSGYANDEVTARADAVKAADEMGAFAVLGGPALTTAFADELAARKVICICTLGGGLPEWYQQRAPYVYTVTANATQGQVHLADYITKQLAGGNADKAGDPALHNKKRVFGHVYIEVNDESAKVAAKLKSSLADKDVALKEQIPYTLDPARLQEQAASSIAKLKSAGVTSVIFSGDPVAPANFTSEATRQDYFPEWIIGPTALVDTAAFARTYDQRQWSHAFGITGLAARTAPSLNPAFVLRQWFTGQPPAAKNTAPVLYPAPSLFFAGVQAAGPNLTPQTFRDGLASLQPQKAVSQPQISFGRHGFWPYDDYNGIDDATEIWWDPNATGPDEIQREGKGLYRYVNGGQRHLPGKWPDTPSTALDPAGTVTIFTAPPPGEAAKDYPPPGN